MAALLGILTNLHKVYTKWSASNTLICSHNFHCKLGLQTSVGLQTDELEPQIIIMPPK